MNLSALVIQIFKPQSSIFAQYLMRNIGVLFLAVFTVIILVVFGNQLVLVIKESLRNDLPAAQLFPIIGLKMVRDVPLILSLSLFLSIILTVSKFYKNSEAVVMNAVGIGDKHLISFIQPLVVVIFLLILFLTTTVVPWSKQQRGLIMERNQSTSEFSFIKQGKFQEFKNGDIVFYAAKVEDVNNTEQVMQNVFIYALINDEPIITLAKQAQKYTDINTNSVYLRLKEGVRYHGFPLDSDKKILNFDLYDLQIIDGNVNKAADISSKSESKSTLELMNSEDSKQVTEFQWRISQPLSVLILSVLGVLLGKSKPRGGKNLGVLFGIAAFIVYNNLMLIAKSSEEGNLWWVHMSALLLVWIFYLYRIGKISNFYLLRKGYAK